MRVLIIYETEKGKDWRKAHTQESVDKFIKDNHLNEEPNYYEIIDLENSDLHNEISLLKKKLNEIKEILK